MMFPGPAGCQDHSFNTASAKAAGHNDALERAQDFFSGLFCQPFRINPVNFNLHILGISCMAQGFCHRQISVMQLHVFAHQADLHLPGLMTDPLHQVFPVLQIRRRALQAQFTADHSRQSSLLQHQRSRIQRRQCGVFNHAIVLHVAEVGNHGEDRFIRDFFICPQHDDVGADTHALQFLHAVLGGLGFMLSAGLQVGYQRHMNIACVVPADFQADLTDGLDKRLALDIADRTADFGDNNVRVGLFADPVNKPLDFIGNVGNGLHRGAEVSALPLLLDDVGIYFTGGQVGVLVQILVNEPLIVTQVQVGFRAVFGHIHLTMLIRTHGSGVRIDIRIQLLGCNLDASRLQQPSQGRRCNALAQT